MLDNAKERGPGPILNAQRCKNNPYKQIKSLNAKSPRLLNPRWIGRRCQTAFDPALCRLHLFHGDIFLLGQAWVELRDIRTVTN